MKISRGVEASQSCKKTCQLFTAASNEQVISIAWIPSFVVPELKLLHICGFFNDILENVI